MTFLYRLIDPFKKIHQVIITSRFKLIHIWLSQPCTSSIDLDEQILVYKCEIPEFLLMNKQKLTNDDGDFDGAEKLEVPYNFLGYIQTLCYVRI